MAKYFDKFPLIPYNIAGTKPNEYQAATNIFFRLRFLRGVLSNFSAYLDYIVQDGDTPEILAEKIYGDPEAHWMILYANDIVDPQFDWPLSNRDFNNYINAKYGSSANAQIQIHHYEKVIERTESVSGLKTTTRFNIDYSTNTVSTLVLYGVSGNFANGEIVYTGANVASANLVGTVNTWSNSTNTLTLTGVVKAPSSPIAQQTFKGANSNASGTVQTVVYPLVPYDTYLGLPATSSYITYTFPSGSVVTENVYRNAVSCYDWEVAQNDAKRTIRIIKKEFYAQILNEFNSLTGSVPSYIRTVNG